MLCKRQRGKEETIVTLFFRMWDYSKRVCPMQGWWCYHGVCACLFPIPQINPFFPRATREAICVVVREGPHLSKHKVWLSWDEGCAEAFMTLHVLSSLPVTADCSPAICLYRHL